MKNWSELLNAAAQLVQAVAVLLIVLSIVLGIM